MIFYMNFTGGTSHQYTSIRTEIWESQDPNIVQEVIRTKQIEIGSQIQRQGQQLCAIIHVLPFLSSKRF